MRKAILGIVTTSIFSITVNAGMSKADLDLSIEGENKSLLNLLR